MNGNYKDVDDIIEESTKQSFNLFKVEVQVLKIENNGKLYQVKKS